MDIGSCYNNKTNNYCMKYCGFNQWWWPLGVKPNPKLSHKKKTHEILWFYTTAIGSCYRTKTKTIWSKLSHGILWCYSTAVGYCGRGKLNLSYDCDFIPWSWIPAVKPTPDLSHQYYLMNSCGFIYRTRAEPI